MVSSPGLPASSLSALRVFVAKVRSLAGLAEDVPPPPPPPVEGVGVSRELVGALTETACGVAVPTSVTGGSGSPTRPCQSFSSSPRLAIMVAHSRALRRRSFSARASSSTPATLVATRRRLVTISSRSPIWTVPFVANTWEKCPSKSVPPSVR